MGKKKEPSHVLTHDDVVEVWIFHWEGWLQSRIAAHFDVNQGRISEALHGRIHPDAFEDACKRVGRAA